MIKLFSEITIEGEGTIRDIKFGENTIAQAICSDSGTFMVEFPNNTKWWDAWVLRDIADAIDKINKPWHDYQDYCFGCMQRGEPYMDWQEWNQKYKK